MKKPWLSNSRKPAILIIGSLLTLLLSSCAQAPQKKLSFAAPPKACWLLQPQVYRLRHSAQLEFQGKQEMLQGFMELDLQNEQARLVIFNSLGMTLLNLEVEPDNYKLSKNKKIKPSGRREQQFAKLVASAVQHIFFSLSHKKEQKRKALAEFDGNPPELIGVKEQPVNPAWVATYHNYKEFTAGRLPQRITLKSNRPQYSLTLWLQKAEIAKKY